MKPSAIVSWLVILSVVLGIIILRVVRRTSAASPQVDRSASVDVQTTIMGKYLIGLDAIMPDGSQPRATTGPASTTGPTTAAGRAPSLTATTSLKQLDETAGGQTPVQRVATAVVAGELVGPDAALMRLREPKVAGLGAPFIALYENGTPLPPDVSKRFGFFGELAESVGKPDTDPQRARALSAARRTAYVIFGAAALFIVGAAVGFGLFITGIVLVSLGKIRPRMDAPAGPDHTYVEAFAIYLVGFTIGSVALLYLLPDAPLWVNFVPMVGSVVLATLWPRLRGTPWAVQRQDWGIHGGANPLLEPLAGVAGYLAGVPIILGGILITVALSRFGQTQVSHPIVEDVRSHPMLVLLLAVVFAPLTEELLFRGGLLSHVRAWAGVAMSAIITGVIFAAIHPQGWAAIPALGSIGAVLALIRQWRGSLVASITAHALNNGFVMTLVLLLAG